MAKLGISFLLLLVSVVFFMMGAVEPASLRGKHSRARAYIVASCRATRYPALCIQCLSGFDNSTIQSPEQMAQLALSVSLYRARYTRSYMLKVAEELQVMKAEEYPAVRDCLHQIDDSVNQLSQSIRELRRLNHQTAVNDDIFWHINNVETWTSAALTDASSCLDEFPAGRHMSKLKATIKGKVLNVAQVTSNALALFHRYAAKYRAAAANKAP